MCFIMAVSYIPFQRLVKHKFCIVIAFNDCIVYILNHLGNIYCVRAIQNAYVVRCVYDKGIVRHAMHQFKGLYAPLIIKKHIVYNITAIIFAAYIGIGIARYIIIYCFPQRKRMVRMAVRHQSQVYTPQIVVYAFKDSFPINAEVKQNRTLTAVRYNCRITFAPTS